MQHLQKTGGWGLLRPLTFLSPIPANVSNVSPIYPLCFHTLAALTDSTALEQLFSNQPVTHSFRRDGGVLPPPVLSPSFPAPSLDRNVSIEDLSPAARNRSSVSRQSRGHQSPVTASCLPLSPTGQSATPSLMYIVPVLFSPLFVRGIARCRD